MVQNWGDPEEEKRGNMREGPRNRVVGVGEKGTLHTL